MGVSGEAVVRTQLSRPGTRLLVLALPLLQAISGYDSLSDCKDGQYEATGS